MGNSHKSPAQHFFSQPASIVLIYTFFLAISSCVFFLIQEESEMKMHASYSEMKMHAFVPDCIHFPYSICSSSALCSKSLTLWTISIGFYLLPSCCIQPVSSPSKKLEEGREMKYCFISLRVILHFSGHHIL